MSRGRAECCRLRSLAMSTTVYTIGHSTRTIGEFIEILEGYGIRTVVDVRTVARSRHNPQFNEQELADALAARNIGYLRIPALGGLRHTSKTSINTGWTNASFRGYADYMQTSEFTAGIEQLISVATIRQTVIMCAEAVPWRCHRSMIGDALFVRGIGVQDILSKKAVREHTLTSWALVDRDRITYPG